MLDYTVERMLAVLELYDFHGSYLALVVGSPDYTFLTFHILDSLVIHLVSLGIADGLNFHDD